MFKALKNAERTIAKGFNTAEAFSAYPSEELQREFPEIDFVVPFNVYPKKRGQLVHSAVAWYRWLRMVDEVETICRAGQRAGVTGPRLDLSDVECIQEAFELKAKVDGEAIRRVLTDEPNLFKERSYHIFMFDTLGRYFPKWKARDFCDFADKACLCGEEFHEERTMQRHRREWRKAIEHYNQFKTNPPKFVRKFLEWEELSRRQMKALNVAHAKNPKIQGIVRDQKEFLAMKKKGFNMEGVVILSQMEGR